MVILLILISCCGRSEAPAGACKHSGVLAQPVPKLLMQLGWQRASSGMLHEHAHSGALYVAHRVDG